MTGPMLQWLIRRSVVVTIVLVMGCGLLDVDDPTAVQDSELTDVNGAILLHDGVLRQMTRAIVQSVEINGVMSDEFSSADGSGIGDASSADLIDRREGDLFLSRNSGYVDQLFGDWQATRRGATIAMTKLRRFPAIAGYLGEMYAVRGFTTMVLAEQYCPGFPLNDVSDYRPVYGRPLATNDAFDIALADLDSAVDFSIDSARLLNFARVVRGRTLLDLGRFTEAAAAVADVPDEYTYLAEFSSTTQTNGIGFHGYAARGVSDREGGNGLDFRSANDPRVPYSLTGLANDGVTPMYALDKYPDGDADIVIASGVEARLIEAEAAFNNGGDWRGILNHLRQTRISPPLGQLLDPATDDARLSLIYRERAFWLFGTGHRLGDLRRLVDYYGRDVESVYPTGAYLFGGVYGVAMSVPFNPGNMTPFNPAVTGCTAP